MTIARRPFLLFAAAMLAAGLAAAQPAERKQREIDHLLDYVARPDCQFYRNGSWYAGDAVRAHLREKADYLQKRGQLPDADAFIQRAASESSVSGKPYQVRCAGMAPRPSGPWLTEELKRYRAGAPPKQP